MEQQQQQQQQKSELKTNDAQIIAQWERMSNPNPFLPSEEPQWTPFKPRENYLIEKAFSNNENEVDLGDYVVLIKEGLQKKKGETFKQRPVRRTTECLEEEGEEIRSERFFGAETPRTYTKAFGNLSDYLVFFQNRDHDIKNFVNIFNQIEASKDLYQLHQFVLPYLFDCFEAESKKFVSIADPNDALKIKKYVKRLFNLFQKEVANFDEFYGKILRAYTMQGFLYQKLNLYLRNEDWTQLDCLLPYAYCVCKAFFHSELAGSHQENKLTLFRGAQFDEVALSFYDQSATKNFSWNSVTSTSRKRDIAEKFMNQQVNLNKQVVPVLFVIEASLEAQSTNHLSWLDIRAFSASPSEDEIVLPPGSVFEIMRVSRDPMKGAEIHLRLMSRVDKLIRGGQVLHGAMQTEMAKDGELRIVCLEGREFSEAIVHLRGNKLIEGLEFCLCEFNEKVMANLTEILETLPNLKKLVFSSPYFVDKLNLGVALKQLETIHLDTLEIYGKEAASVLTRGLGGFKSLQSLTIDFNRLFGTKDQDVETLCLRGIQHLTQLTSLDLNFFQCYEISDKGLETLCVKGLQYLPLLVSFSLNFRLHYKVTDKGIEILESEGIRHLPSLIFLSLDFDYCTELTSVGKQNLSKLLAQYQRVPSEVDAKYAKPVVFERVSGKQEKNPGVVVLDSMKELGNFQTRSSCEHLKIEVKLFKSMDDLCSVLANNPHNPSSLILNFKECEQINSETLSCLLLQGIVPLGSLTSLTLDFNKCWINMNQTLKELYPPMMRALASITSNIDWSKHSGDESLSSAWLGGIQYLSSLTSLNLDFTKCKVTDEFLIDLSYEGLKHLTSLTSLTLSLSENAITDEGLSHLSQGLKYLTSITLLNLDFTKNKITDVSIVYLACEGMELLTELTDFSLKLNECPEITNEGVKLLCSQGIKNLPLLKSLSLHFKSCEQITDEGLIYLWSQGIQHLTLLTSLTLNFDGCNEISDHALKYLNCQELKKLEVLSLTFCEYNKKNPRLNVHDSKITNAGLRDLCLEGIQHLVSLKSLTLDLHTLASIKDEGLNILCSQGLKYLSSLTSLSLNLTGCVRISDTGIKTLCSEGIKNLPLLSSLTLHQSGFGITDEALNTLCWQAIKDLTSLTYLHLDFENCDHITPAAWKNFHKIVKYFGFTPQLPEAEEFSTKLEDLFQKVQGYKKMGFTYS